MKSGASSGATFIIGGVTNFTYSRYKIESSQASETAMAVNNNDGLTIPPSSQATTNTVVLVQQVVLRSNYRGGLCTSIIKISSVFG
mmetsp:Transcript_19458/g.32281  ORF Transcript_19458/g.32281 Transcript_19458/m.32281 type:complete len:86 (-) Transcript_19458:72-329(-)